MKKSSHPSFCRCKSFVICKYNRPHGTVFCALEEKPPSDSEVALHITICDTGVGMEQDFLQEIFKPYVQADALLQGIGMGAGLDIPKLTEAIQNSAPLPPTTAGWWGEQTPPALYKSKAGGVCFGLIQGS